MVTVSYRGLVIQSLHQLEGAKGYPPFFVSCTTKQVRMYEGEM